MIDVGPASGPAFGRALSAVLAAGAVVLDGGLATELEAQGCDVSSALWSARLLRDDPAAVVAAHAAFTAAGAQVATTASYQATLPGLEAAGLSRREAERLIASSVTLAREGLEEGLRQRGGTAIAPGWVAGSVGPYGAALADGSEYTGAYLAGPDAVSQTELREFHRPRLQLLAQAGADVLACETLPGAAEVEALLAELEALGVPAWVSLTTATGPDGVVRTRRGEPAAAVLAAAASVPCVVAVGVNCTDPEQVPAALAQVAAATAGTHLVAYPNSGEIWDAEARSWDTGGGAGQGNGEGAGVGDVGGWLAAGARLVGGCCRVGPAHVRAIADQVAPAPGAQGSQADWA